MTIAVERSSVECGRSPRLMLIMRSRVSSDAVARMRAAFDDWEAGAFPACALEGVDAVLQLVDGEWRSVYAAPAAGWVRGPVPGLDF